MTDLLARLSWRHPRKVLVVALLFAATAGFTDPDSESERAGQVLAAALPLKTLIMSEVGVSTTD